MKTHPIPYFVPLRFVSEKELERIEFLNHKASPAQVQALIREVRHLQSLLKGDRK